jgi:hypothetical protein
MDKCSSSDTGSPSARLDTKRVLAVNVSHLLTGAFVNRLLTLSTVLTLGFGLLFLSPADARAQEDDPHVLDLAQPDFTLVSLPTARRLPTFGSAFRVTHRFLLPLNPLGRPPGEQNFGALTSNFFGLDTGAQIGLEYRFGIVPNGQIGVNRTSDKTIEFFGQYDLMRQGKSLPVDLTVLATTDGINNFKGTHSPAFGAIISRIVSKRAAFYVEPIGIHNSNVLPQPGSANDTFMVGLGTRVRIRPTVYVVAETAPRVSGYMPGANQTSFAIEKRAGGHVFQLNFSNSIGTTMGQIARGGPDAPHDWFLGFNISRKFF